MTTHLRVMTLAIVIASSSMSVFAQSLNPTVTVVPNANAQVPVDCVDGATPPVQRAQVETPAPQPRVVPAPAARQTVVQPTSSSRTGSLRDELRAAHAAALGRDRASYDAAISAAKSLVANAGGDRDLGTAARALFDDVTRLWDYQLNAPVGSFFDANADGGALLRSLTRHAGYEAAVRRQIVTDANGTRYYPTRESIEFVLGVIATRLGGLREAPAPARDVTADRSSSPSPQPRATTPSISESTRRQAPRVTSEGTRKPSSTSARKPRPSASSSRRTGTSPRKQTTSAQGRETRVTTATDDPPLPAGVVSSTAMESQPPDAATAGETPTAGTSVTTETVTTTATITEVPPEPSATLDTAASETTATAAPSQPQPSQRRRSVILPIVLILIGVGVLIVLFRASA